MDMNLKGKRVLVTGGTRGIGRGICDAFVAEGARVALCARSEGQVAEVGKAFTGKDVMARVADAADAVAMEKILAEIDAQWGGLDVLVTTVSAQALKGGDEAWEATFNADLLGVARLVRNCLPRLKASKGSVVMIGSTASSEMSPHIGGMFGGEQPYGVAKAGMLSYAKTMSTDLAPQGVRINVVSPGNIFCEGGSWDQFKVALPDLYSTMLKENPMGRMGSVAEVASCVLFLASDKASFVTGQNLIVDGGLTRGIPG